MAYTIIRRHQARLRRHGANIGELWEELTQTFRSQVLGPRFESMARSWAMHFASHDTLGGASVSTWGPQRCLSRTATPGKVSNGNSMFWWPPAMPRP